MAIPGKDRYKILVVDDHQMIIDGIRSLLRNDKHFSVVATTTNPAEVPALLAEHQPDLLISDLEMGPPDGIELCKTIRIQYPKLPILALSMFGDYGHITKALEAGFSGYILKNTGYNELVQALQTLMAGKSFYSDAVSHEVLKGVAQRGKETAVQPMAFPSLTEREMEVLQWMAKELSNAEIGEKLCISERTVETHRKNIFRKTDTKSVIGLIRFAIKNGLIHE